MMTTQEFKNQIFKTNDQWKSGLLYRLEMLKEEGKEGGITLYSMPTFVQWIQEVDGIKNPTGLAIDECGQIYFIDAEACLIYHYDPGTKRLEHIPCIGGCGSDAGKFKEPGRIIIDKFTMWVLDAGNHRIQTFSKENYQIKYIIDNLKEPIDIAIDGMGHLYVLDKGLKQIHKYDNNGNLIKSFGEVQLKEPVGLAVGKDKSIYVIDKEYNGFLIFKENGEYEGLKGDFTGISGFQPSVIAIDKKGNIFVGDEKAGCIYQFDADGSYIGKITIPDNIESIQGIAIDLKGNLYVSSNKGIALMGIEKRFTKEQGIYYSKTLDSGIHGCQWHRLSFKADIPEKTVVEVYYYSNDNDELKTKIDKVLSDTSKSTQQKKDLIDSLIPSWIGPEKNPEDMLFREKTGRYLWLKLVLSTFDDTVRPAIRQMKAYYLRISYLRYLPAIYQEDPVSKGFLERFLSVFESVFYDLETDISKVFRYFDPDTVPQNFLSWLASWLNIALEEDWPEEKKRQLIREASTIYKQKGTPAALRRLIEIYTEKTPIILEYLKIGKPMVLGKEFRLGISSILIQTPIRGFSLGDDSILGRAALRDIVQSPEDPFLPLAHRFTIVINLSSEELTLYEKGLRQILNEEKPAHTTYSLKVAKDMRVSMGAYIGISTKVSDYRPLQIGVDSILGTDLIAFDSGEKSAKVERHSKVGADTLLI